MLVRPSLPEPRFGRRGPRGLSALLLAALLPLASISALAVPAEWEVGSGGNGHLYEVVLFPATITWDDAASGGVKKLVAASGPIGKGKLRLSAGNKASKGQTSLPTGAAVALEGTAAATVQVFTTDALCYGASLGTVKKADGTQFKAKAP